MDTCVCWPQEGMDHASKVVPGMMVVEDHFVDHELTAASAVPEKSADNCSVRVVMAQLTAVLLNLAV